MMLLTTELDICLKNSIIDLFYYFGKIKVHSYDSLPIEKTLTLHNVITLVKQVLYKDKNQ